MKSTTNQISKNHSLLSQTMTASAQVYLILGALMLLGPAALGALRLWTGAGADAYWSTAANWNPAGAPQNGDDLGFTAGMPRQTSTNDLAGRQFNSLIFSGATNSYTLFGGPFWLSTGVNSLQSSGTVSLNFVNIRLNANQEFIADGSQLSFGGEVDLNGHTLTLRTTTSNATL